MEDNVFAFKLAALAELILVILESAGFVRVPWLPLGGGQIQQIGLVFATAYVAAESIDLVKAASKGVARPEPNRTDSGHRRSPLRRTRI